MSLGYHLVLRTRDAAPFATTPAQHRQLARLLLTVAREHALLAFGLADQHLHVYPAEDRPRSGELARRIGVALSHGLKLAGGVYTSLIKPVADGFHAYKLFDYVLRQGARHQLESDPLLEATNLPDLLGLRLLGRRTALSVRRLLPRVKRPQLLALFGVETLEPIEVTEATEASLSTVIDAGLSAAALTKLDAGDASRQLRRAIVEVVGDSLPRAELARALGVWPRSLRRMLASAPAPRDLVQAIRLQLDLRRQKAPDLARLASSF